MQVEVVVVLVGGLQVQRDVLEHQDVLRPGLLRTHTQSHPHTHKHAATHTDRQLIDG